MPIRAATQARVNNVARRRRFPSGRQNGTSIFVETGIPRFSDVWLGKDKLPVCAIENVKHSVTVGLHEQLLLLARDGSISQNQVFIGVPVVRVAGRELVMPLSFASCRIQRDDGTGRCV